VIGDFEANNRVEKKVWINLAMSEKLEIITR